MESENINSFLNNLILNTILSDDFDNEVKIRKIERFIDFGGDVKAQIFGKSMLVWAKERNVGDGIIEYLEKRGVKEEFISKEESDEKAKGFWDENGEIKSLEEIKKLVYEGANLGGNVNGRNVFRDLGVEEINEVLKILPKGYVIDGDVMLLGKNLRKLPDFSNVIVAGDFWCSNNQLTSLRGAPKEVGGCFACWENQLTSLEGAPTEVGGGFYCSGNRLTSLEGGPEKVGEDFMCHCNKLTSLKGAPMEVGGNFECYNNQLTSLEGAPKKVGGDFRCYKNQLTSLRGAPKEVGGSFYCSSNQLTSLRGGPKKVGWGFDCHENQLTSLRGAPTEVGGDFDCKENESLESLDGRPKKIGRGFYCNKEVLERIEKNKKIEQNFSGFDNGR